MKNRRVVFLSVLVVSCAAACGPAGRGAVPLREGPARAPDQTLVWIGFGEAERFEGGSWVRHPELDYEFSVEQRRYEGRWESVKQLRRLHPGYDGVAGPREQTYFFGIDWASTEANGRLAASVQSSLGSGEGYSDPEFRVASLTLHADGSAFAPFDTYRIEQNYAYARGTLTETVSLEKGSAPWVRNREAATLFAAQSLATPAAPR